MLKNRTSKKKRVVRMLEQAVKWMYNRADFSGHSEIKAGRSETSARNSLRKLKKLAENDPDNRFGICFTRLLTKLLKDIRRKGQ